MSGINQHIILGNVGKIESRFTPDGKQVVSMSVATSEKWKDKNSGQQQEKTDWHNVVVFGKPAEIIGQYVNKGDKIYLSGKVVTRKWQDTTGADRYTTETVIDGFNGKFELLGGKKDNANQAPQNNQQQPQQQNQMQNNANQVNQPLEDDFVDDIPFN